MARSTPAAARASSPSRLGGAKKSRDRRRLRIAAGLPQVLAQRGDLLDRVGVRAQDRHPTVAVLHHPVEGPRAVAADDDRGVRPLEGLRVGPDPLEAHELALVARLPLRPDRLHGQHTLAQEPPARLEGGAVVLHLLGVPAAADPEEHATAREPVQRGHFLGRDDRVALDHEADAGAELEASRRGGGGHQGEERIVGRPVVARQLAAGRPRAPAARRDVRVLREPHRLEAALLEGAGQLVRRDRVLGGEHDDAVIHDGPPWGRGRLYYPVRRTSHDLPPPRRRLRRPRPGGERPALPAGGGNPRRCRGGGVPAARRLALPGLPGAEPLLGVDGHSETEAVVTEAEDVQPRVNEHPEGEQPTGIMCSPEAWSDSPHRWAPRTGVALGRSPRRRWARPSSINPT